MEGLDFKHKVTSKLLFTFLLDLTSYLDQEHYNYCILSFDMTINSGTVPVSYIRYRLVSKYVANVKMYKIKYYEKK